MAEVDVRSIKTPRLHAPLLRCWDRDDYTEFVTVSSRPAKAYSQSPSFVVVIFIHPERFRWATKVS
jgi:hypothetical protein